jgi:hypothetical protein
MDISELNTLDAHESGAEFEVRDQNGNLIDAKIIIAGVDSRIYRKETTKMRRDIIVGKNENLEDLRAKVLGNITLGWSGFTSKGKEHKFTNKRAYDLYVKAPYIMDQIDAFISDRENFTKG